MKNSVKNRICRLLALILSLVAVIAVTPVAVPAAVTYDDVKTDDTEELRRRLEKMTEESNALAAKIKSAEQSEADALARKELYDQMHNLYIEQLTVLEGQMAALEAEFAECEREAERLEKEYEQSYENFCGLLRMTYEEGSSSYIAILLGAENLGDLLARAERVAGMIGYNKRLMQRVKEANAELESKKAELDESRAKLAESESQLKVKQEELDAWDAENEKLLAELEAQIQADKESAEKLDASLSAANNELDALVSKLIAEEEERQRKIEEALRQQQLEEEERRRLELEKILQEEMEKQSSSEEYTWPLPSKYNRITSWFNEDRNLIEIGYKDTHGGMDIAAPNGTPIYAVKTGRVILAGVVSGYGNCVMIDHGNGIVSIYGHASRLLCKTGDIVTKGQNIALVGLTGITTGYHLHIEFRKNGVRVEPLNYISIPKS